MLNTSRLFNMNAITLWLVYPPEICGGFLFGGSFYYNLNT